jgi:hypothetical protein
MKARGAGSKTVTVPKKKTPDGEPEPAKELVKNNNITSFF